jgi:magnesium chelatase family protein
MTFAMHRSPDGARRAFILPAANADEAALVSDAAIYPADTLLQVCAHFAARRRGRGWRASAAGCAGSRPAIPTSPT